MTSKAQALLQTLYEKVETLQEFLEQYGFKLFEENKVHEKGYINLLQTCLVCLGKDQGAPSLRAPKSSEPVQTVHQHELVYIAIKRLLRNKEKNYNLLTFGFSQSTSNKSSEIVGHGVEKSSMLHSNHSFDTLTSGPWKYLLSRIGDEMMQYLLETRSIYIASPPSNYIQVTGPPLYREYSFELIEGRILKSKFTPGSVRKRKHGSTTDTDDRPAKKVCRALTFATEQRKTTKESESSATKALAPQSAPAAAAKLPATGSANTESLVNFEGALALLDDGSQSSNQDEELVVVQDEVRPVMSQDEVSQDDTRPEVRETSSVINQDKATQILSRDEGVPAKSHDDKTAVIKLSKSKKRRQRRLKLKTSLGALPQQTKESPRKMLYRFHQAIPKRSVLYAKNLRESLSNKFLLKADNLSAEGLVEKIWHYTSVSPSQVKYQARRKRVVEGKANIAVPAKVKEALLPMLNDLIQRHRKCKYRFILNAKCPSLGGRATDKTKPNASKKSTRKNHSENMLKIPKVPVFKRGEKQDSERTKLGQSIDCLVSSPLNTPEVNCAEKACQQQDETESSKDDKRNEMLASCHAHDQVFLFLRSILLKVVPLELFGSKSNRSLFLKVMKKFVNLGKFEKIFLGELLRKMNLRRIGWLKGTQDPRLKEYLCVCFLHSLLTDFVLPLITSYFYVTDHAVYKNALFYYRKSSWTKLYKLGLEDLMKKGMFRPLSKEEAANMNSLGLCTLRFLPKLAGLRPILNLAAHSAKTQSINMQLNDVFYALTFLKKRQNKEDSSIQGIEEIYKRWHGYVTRCHQNNIQNLYFVKVDIKSCFDSIFQDKLLEIITDMFHPIDNFVIRKYATVKSSAGHVRTSFKRDVTYLYDYLYQFRRFVAQLVKATGTHDTIFIDQVYNQKEESSYFLKKLQRHLKHNVVQAGEQKFLQTVGISQGSILSTLLCSMYYSHMEQRYLKVGENDLLMRLVDDFLYVTPDLEAAKSFLSTMLKGIVEYNCHTQPMKSATNFVVSDEGVQMLLPPAWFPWCGFLFNTTNMEVQLQSDRYAGLSMRETISFNPGLCPGKNLKIKLQQTLRIRLVVILLDPEINSWNCQVMNAWKMFLLCAFRCHSCLVSVTHSHINASYLHSMIEDLAGFFHQQIKQYIIAKAERILPRLQISWLCLSAFVLKFTLHHGKYFTLLKKLRNSKREVEKKLGKKYVKKLLKVTGNKTPEEFHYIFT